jgi:hypothetical protein
VSWEFVVVAYGFGFVDQTVVLVGSSGIELEIGVVVLGLAGGG